MPSTPSLPPTPRAGSPAGTRRRGSCLVGRGMRFLGGSCPETVIPSSYREAHERGLAHFLAIGEGPVLGRRIELTALRRNGTEFPIELAITPMRVAGATVFSAFLHDISERKRAEQA